MQKVDAVVLAGGSLKGISLPGIPAKGLLPIGDRLMLNYVVEALKGCSRIGRIVVVIPSAKGVALPEGAEFILNDGSLTDNIYAGMGHLKTGRMILLVSGDIPLLTTEGVDNFLKCCEREKAQVYYPIIPQKDVERRFPGVRRTYAALRDGTFTGGNLALVDPGLFESNRDLLERLYGFRKSPLKLARVLGFSFVLKFLLHLLTIEAAEKRLSNLIGGQGRAVITPHPEIGMDVDKDSDLELARRILS